MSRRPAGVRGPSRSRRAFPRTIEILEQRVLLSAGPERGSSGAVVAPLAAPARPPLDAATLPAGRFTLVPGGIASDELSHAEIARLIRFLERPAVAKYLENPDRVGPFARQLFGQPVTPTNGTLPSTPAWNFYRWLRSLHPGRFDRRHSRVGDALRSDATIKANNNPTPKPRVAPTIEVVGPPSGTPINHEAVITGSVAAGSSPVVSLTAQQDSGPSVSVPFDPSTGHFTFTTTYPLDGTRDGTHTLSFRALDQDGSTSNTATSSFTLDTIAPAPVGLRLTPATDSGASQTDGITKVNTPVVDVTAEAGSTVRLMVDGAQVGQQVASGGDLAFRIGPMSDGVHQVTAIAVDAAGNQSRLSDPFALTIKTTAPTVPMFHLSVGSQSGSDPTQTNAAIVTLVGRTDPRVSLSLVGSSLTASSTGTGSFQFPGISLALGGNAMVIQATDLAGNVSRSASTTITRSSGGSGAPDAVMVWNQATLDAIQTDGTDPLMASRSLAMVQSAVYDAVSNIEGTPAYYVRVASPSDASLPAAIDAAAHDVLSYLYPAQQSTFDALFNTEIGALMAGQGTTDGETVGQAVGNAIIALRANDGSKSYVDYVTGTAAGDWQPTAPAYATPLDPQGANMTPWGMTSPGQFDPSGPPALTSQQWADAVNQVKGLGAVDSTTRTADQTQTAQFWNDGIGTYTPAGHWNAIAQTVSAQAGQSLDVEARLFAELDVSLADAAIAAWNTKYDYDTWRPITVIQGGGDGVNPGVTADPTWHPYLTTPNFPEYVSGHSTYSAAASTVLDAFFGTNVGFSSTEQTLPGVTRTFTGFDQAAQEAGMSRIYAGIHFMFSNLDGQATGKAVANWDMATFDVSHDVIPPRIAPDNVLPSGASKTNVTITGQATDNLSGVSKLEVKVDNGAYVPIAFDAATGAFTYTSKFALNGSADGSHTITFEAIDADGNAATPLPFTFALDTQAPRLAVTSPTSGGSLASGATLTGTAKTNGAKLVALSYTFDGGTTMPVAFNADGSFRQALDLSKLAPGAPRLVVKATDAAGNTASQTLNLTLTTAIPLTVASVTPAAGSTDVGVTFRPRVYFSRPVDPSTLDSSNVYATDSAGATIPATVVPSDDGLSAWLFFSNPLPGASTITLNVNGATIKGADGSLLDAAGDGTSGSTLTSKFSTVSIVAVPGTSIGGIVADPGADGQAETRDDVRSGADGVLGTADDVYLKTVAGATVYILGEEDQAVTSGADGSFSLTSVPSGDVKLVIDGRTATNAPTGYFYPEMVFDLTIRPGVANTVMGSMGTAAQQAAMGTAPGAYLPRLQSAILHPAGGDSSTTIGLDPGSTISGLTSEQASEYSITVAPNSLIGMDGRKLTDGTVGFSTVSPSLIQGMLPQGVMQLATTLTIQAPGVAAFSTPLAVTFANVYGAAPGSQLAVYSFNHTTGLLEFTGTATVSADGKTATTDPGSGITHPGWFGVTPPGDTAGPGGDGCGDMSGPAQGPDAGNTDTNQVDFDFIHDQEDHANPHGTLHTYPPPSSTSGVTVASGVDLGQNPVDTLDVPDELKTKLEPYSGSGGPAYEAAHGDVTITQTEADELNTAVAPVIMDPLISAYDAASSIPFNQLPPDAQTVIADMAYQYGSDLATRTPNFWDQVTHQRWQDAVNNLDNFGDAYTSRRHDERDLLQNVLNNDDENGEDQNEDWSAANDGAGQVVTGDPVPQGGDHYWALYNLNTNRMELRGVSHNGQVISSPIFLEPHTDFRLYILDPVTLDSGYTDFTTGPSGQSIGFPQVNVGPRVGYDSDGDGLSYLDEFILGTDPEGFSTANDGISDLAALQAGLNAFSSIVPPTGVIATLPLQGDARSVVVAGSTSSVSSRTAYVATGSYGVAVVDASNIQKPVVLSQLSMLGQNNELGVDTTDNLVAVASGGTGLHIVDVTDPTAPALKQTVNMDAEHVQVEGNYAYVASGSQISVVDLTSGSILSKMSYSGGTIDDMAIADGFLYTIGHSGIEPHTVNKIALSDILAAPVASITIDGHPTFGQMHIFAGDGYIYVGAADNNDSQQIPGVEVIQDNGTTLTLVGPSSAITAFDVAVNGSGLALFTGADPSLTNSTKVGLLDLTDPTQTAEVVTIFDTPGVTNGLAIANGIGFVADGSAGLAILNYLSFDTKGVPPTVNLSTSLSGGNVIEGTSVPLQVSVSDDVQVRNVELLVNGVVVQNAVSFPFNLSAVAPAITSTSSTVTLQVEAFDTGGNMAVSNTLTLNLVKDTTPPAIVSISPSAGSQLIEGAKTLQISFTKPLDAATVTAANFTLFEAGTSGAFDGTETAVPLTVTLRNNGTLVQLTTDAGLVPGLYELRINGAAVTDRAGNALGSDVKTSDFNVTARPDLSDLFNLRGTPVAGQQILDGTLFRVGMNGDGSFITDDISTGLFYQGVDFLTPGSPLAGFSIGYNGQAYVNGEANGEGSAIPVTLEDISSGSFHGLRITGMVGDSLQLERVVAFNDGDSFITIATRLTNVSADTVHNVAWLENWDPDQGVQLGLGYDTTNAIALGGHFIQASVTGDAFPDGLTVGFGSPDPLVVLGGGGFEISDPFEVINSPYDPAGATSDTSINAAFNYGDLAAGQSVSSALIVALGATIDDAQAAYTSAAAAIG